MKEIYLICNAHIDPVWLWQKEEGMAEAVSTFRIAADFCEEFDGFVFNHNEALLYEWVEEYEPELFNRIQRLVKEGKWNIIGGWYVQPDCNMPCGESIYRQIERGKRYFKEKFHKEPTTAINFDSFGHARGLVQILVKNGYDSYVFGRPQEKQFELPGENFLWEGYDGSRICAHRAYDMYLSLRGEAVKKIRNYIRDKAREETGLLLWGIGDHGGGPSKEDWLAISQLDLGDVKLIHSGPEAFFSSIETQDLPVVTEPLQPVFVGCYTSQCRVKQAYRRLENEIYSTEKMLAHACLEEKISYPEKQIKEAVDDLLFAQFHDALPGTTIKPVEEEVLQQLAHGLEIMKRLKARAFFALVTGEEKAAEGEIPIFVYNPHPFNVRTTVECELQLADQNWDQETITDIMILNDGRIIPSQLEKEHANLNLDWRKHVVFEAELKASGLSRFTCIPKKKTKRELDSQTEGEISWGMELILRGECREVLKVSNSILTVIFDQVLGNVISYQIKGKEMLTDAMQLEVYQTDEDPWNSSAVLYDQYEGKFKLCCPLRIIEQGYVRTVVEGVYTYGDSRAEVLYKIPKHSSAMEVEVHVDWREENSVLKWVIPSIHQEKEIYYGEDMFGTAKLEQNGQEMVSQRWCGLKGGLAVVNRGIYGSSCIDGRLALTLLQSSVYAALTIEGRKIVNYDRHLPFIDIGERYFKICIDQWDQEIFRKADLFNQVVYAQSFFPAGSGKKSGTFIQIDAPNVEVASCYLDEGELKVRMYETEGAATQFNLRIPNLNIEEHLLIQPYEILTYQLTQEKGN